MEIKNLIFDIGNVLLKWDPEGIYTTLFGRKDFYNHPLSVIIGGEIWLELDQGLINLDEGIKKATMGNEDYREEIERFFREAPYHFYPIEETLNQALRYKKLGYKIFLLSNFHKYGYGILKERFPFFDNFDGGVISFEVKLNKPDRRIYDSLLLKYNLDPSESLFIDDMEENITAAEELGIQGIHYSSNINLELELGKIES